ncbi:MAG: hypothetical protein ACQEP1_03930 [Nanobdellota archaeon]
MNTKKIIDNLEESEEFKKFKEENPDTYLAHVFKMLDKQNVEEWQIGYYDKSNRKVTTFVYNEKTETIQKNPESETFRKEDSHIKELKKEDINTNLNQAMQKVEKLRNEKYSKHPVEKSFFILQNLGNPVWNFTLVTKTFNVLNVKVNASSGEVEEDNLSSIFDFKEKAY